MCTETQWHADATRGDPPARTGASEEACEEARRVSEWRGRPIADDVLGRLLESMRAERPQ
jgi:hypothetical protein